jgi:hypothetical protein
MAFRKFRVALPVVSPNPHLTLWGLGATTHVTTFLPILTGLHFALSTASPLLTCLAWDLLIPGRAAVESVNSWREGFRGARTGSREFALISILERRSHSIGKLL